MSRVWAGVCMNQMMKTAHSACGHPFIIFQMGMVCPPYMAHQLPQQSQTMLVLPYMMMSLVYEVMVSNSDSLCNVCLDDYDGT